MEMWAPMIPPPRGRVRIELVRRCSGGIPPSSGRARVLRSMERESRRRDAQAAAGAPVNDSDADVQAGALDVSSESFDPLLALYSPSTPLPYPDARCFNNLAEYESFLRGGGRARGKPDGAPKPAKKGKKPAPDPERVERLKKLMVVPEEGERARPPRKRRKPPKNVLTRMPLHQGGPLGALYRCVQERLKIRVHIRTFKGLRGVCSGFIVAFDKFWNMVMVDVDETYRKPILGQAYYHEPKLTLAQLFNRLKLQDCAVQSEPQSAAEKTPRARTPHDGSTERTSSGRDPGGFSHPPVSVSTPQGQERPCVWDEKPKPRTRQQKEKVDYQKVFTRHMKQVFIRGESILLVHLPQ